MVNVGSVIQVKEHVPAWGGCLMVVEVVKPWGIVAVMRLPGRDKETTALRLNHGEYICVGELKGEEE